MEQDDLRTLTIEIISNARDVRQAYCEILNDVVVSAIYLPYCPCSVNMNITPKHVRNGSVSTRSTVHA